MEAIETTNDASNSSTEPIIIPAQQLAAIKSTSKEVTSNLFVVIRFFHLSFRNFLPKAETELTAYAEKFSVVCLFTFFSKWMSFF